MRSVCGTLYAPFWSICDCTMSFSLVRFFLFSFQKGTGWFRALKNTNLNLTHSSFESIWQGLLRHSNLLVCNAFPIVRKCFKDFAGHSCCRPIFQNVRTFFLSSFHVPILDPQCQWLNLSFQQNYVSWANTIYSATSAKNIWWKAV